MRDRAERDGAWEEPGVLGSRIEIDGKKIVFLWRNGPVLETTFKAVRRDGKTFLELKENGLKNPGSAADYATVEELFLEDGKLHMTEHFPMSGDSRTVMSRTDRSRYGNYDAVPIPAAYHGKWKDQRGYFEISITKDKVVLNGTPFSACQLIPRSGGPCLLADRDPSVYDWQGLSRFVCEGDRLTTSMMICDAPSVHMEFFREE